VNTAFDTIIASSDADRAGLFAETATRLGTPAQNVEKDFWVCWTLDALFNGLPEGSPRLLFKGGTSLSKAFDLIPRFSEDIDITVFREDIGQPVDPAELEELSGKQRRIRLNQIRDACQAYIGGPLADQLRERLAAFGNERLRVELDSDDTDSQTLLLWYPTALARDGDYIRSAVKIEAGAKSALDPHRPATVQPYVAQELPDLDLKVGNVTTVDAERTFWDKVIIVHGLRQRYEQSGELHRGGQRVSRHYFDLHQLMHAQGVTEWLQNKALAADCARHARLFFGSPAAGLDRAAHGTFTLTPPAAMGEALQRDYVAMSGMIFGPVPEFAAVLERIAEIESIINS